MSNQLIAGLLLCAVCAVAPVGLTITARAQAGPFRNPPPDLATQVLPANDGWAATAPGETAVATLTLSSSAGADGAAVAERYTGTYTGGTFGASIRASLP